MKLHTWKGSFNDIGYEEEIIIVCDVHMLFLHDKIKSTTVTWFCFRNLAPERSQASYRIKF